MMTSQRIRIQKALIERFSKAEFYRVTYDSQGLPQTNNVNDAARVTPNSVFCNETNASFEIDSNYGTSLRQKKSGWSMTLMFDFDTEVLLEYFEREYMEKPLTVPRTTDSPNATIFIKDKKVNHPITGSNNAGTEGTKGAYTFFIDEGRS